MVGNEVDKKLRITIGGQIRKKRIESLPDKLQKKIRINSISGYDETALRKQRRQLKYDPRNGDIFNLITYDGYQLQGIVLRSHVGKFETDDYMSVVILKPDIQPVNLKNDLKREHILLGPKLVDIAYWKKGFFNYTKSLGEMNIFFSYAFCEEKAIESWINENGEHVEVLNYEDFDFLYSYAYTMANGFASLLNDELIINGYK